MSDSSSTSSGIGTGGLLLVAFIILKLTEVIDWKWIWVLSPLWLGLALVLFIFAIYIVIKSL